MAERMRSRLRADGCISSGFSACRPDSPARSRLDTASKDQVSSENLCVSEGRISEESIAMQSIENFLKVLLTYHLTMNQTLQCSAVRV
jgi:hypothetical protein